MKKEDLQELVYYILERYFKEYGAGEMNIKAYLIMTYISGESELISNSLIEDGVVDSNATINLIKYKEDIQDNVTLEYVFEAVEKINKERLYY